jgi:hypothetical protein
MGSMTRRMRRTKQEREETTMAEKKRYITIPEPTIKAGAFQFTALMFVAHFVERHPLYTRTAQGFRAGQRVLAAFEREPGDHSELRNDDWMQLKEIVLDPGETGYPTLTHHTPDGKSKTFPLPGGACLPFIDAIEEAGTTPPKTEDAPTQEAAE